MLWTLRITAPPAPRARHQSFLGMDAPHAMCCPRWAGTPTFHTPMPLRPPLAARCAGGAPRTRTATPRGQSVSPALQGTGGPTPPLTLASISPRAVGQRGSSPPAAAQSWPAPPALAPARGAPRGTLGTSAPPAPWGTTKRTRARAPCARRPFTCRSGWCCCCLCAWGCSYCGSCK